jgi:hypothetical protein
MGAHDVLDALKRVTVDPAYSKCVEWLGCPWGHAVAPSTPPQDYRLHVLAWQQHFASHFRLEALERVKGFSPSEMALPNHPDVAYAFVKTLRDCGFTWVIVQEHTVELADGRGPGAPHIPHRLVAASSTGEGVHHRHHQDPGQRHQAGGADAALYEAARAWALGAGRPADAAAGHPDCRRRERRRDDERIPAQVHGGRCASVPSDTPLMNGSEYLEHLFALGIKEKDFPARCQPLFSKRIWDPHEAGRGAGEAGQEVIEELRKRTTASTWKAAVGPAISPGCAATKTCWGPWSRPAPSCYRYWGQGLWTDYGREICRRVSAIVEADF